MLPHRPSLRQLRAWLTLGAAFAGLAATAPAAAVSVGFDTFANGTLVTSQLQASHGVSFPGGVIATTYGGARSAPNVAQPRFDGEFQRHPFEATFATNQNAVTVWFQAELGGSITFTLRGYGPPPTNTQVGIATLAVNDSLWHSLSVGNSTGSPTVRRVLLTAAQSGNTTNFMRVDDLTFSTTPPPPPPDTTLPTILIRAPVFGQTIGQARVDITVDATDDRQLFTVDGRVERRATHQVVGRMDYCGTVTSGPCPSRRLVKTFITSLAPASDGEHEIFATACDAARNCATTTVRFFLDLPDPPAEVSVKRAEVNQGVQNRLVEVPRPGDTSSGFTGVRTVAGRRTVIRFYPLAAGRPRPGYTALMRAKIIYHNGTTLERASMPNAGHAAVDVAADPGSAGQSDEYLRMRIDEARTLNYVIPGSLLADADELQVRLEVASEPITGWLGIGFSPAVRLAVRTVRLFGPGIPAGSGPPPAGDIDNCFRYLEESYPVSEVVRIDAGGRVILEDPLCEAFASLGSDVPDLSCALWQFSHFDPPGTPRPDGTPTYVVALGQVNDNSFGRVGIATSRSVIAMPFNDAAYAHEIGHAVGRPHVGPPMSGGGGPHGEDGVEDWPHPHGLMGATNFGVITSNLVAPGTFDLGEWELQVVDPCPTSSLGQRASDCSAPMEGIGTHDFMSYGTSSTDLGPLNSTSFGKQWISDINWNRLYQTMASQGIHTAHRSAGALADALLIDGVVREDGTIALLPCSAKRYPPKSWHRRRPAPSHWSSSVPRGSSCWRAASLPPSCTTAASSCTSSTSWCPTRPGLGAWWSRKTAR